MLAHANLPNFDAPRLNITYNGVKKEKRKRETPGLESKCAALTICENLQQITKYGFNAPDASAGCDLSLAARFNLRGAVITNVQSVPRTLRLFTSRLDTCLHLQSLSVISANKQHFCPCQVWILSSFCLWFC